MTQPAPGDDRPGRYDDLPWRVRYRIRRGLLHVFGPPQLGGDADPLSRLDRERERRLADRAAARAAARDSDRDGGTDR